MFVEYSSKLRVIKIKMANSTIVGLAKNVLGTRNQRLSDMVLRGALVLALLFVQAVDLSHTHSDDLVDTVDCQICLKVGSADDVLVSTNLLLAIEGPTSPDFVRTLESPQLTSPRATARAPPQV